MSSAQRLALVREAVVQRARQRLDQHANEQRNASQRRGAAESLRRRASGWHAFAESGGDFETSPAFVHDCIARAYEVANCIASDLPIPSADAPIAVAA